VPIDPRVALSAPAQEQEFSWTTSDVLLYHLALGAGAQPNDPRELRYTFEKNLQVLPTFAVVAATLRATEAPRVASPGIDIELSKVVHGGQGITVHRPLPTEGTGRASTKVTEIWDKASAAVIVSETEVVDAQGNPLWTSRSSVFARGEGGFGGERGPSSASTTPDREPDQVLHTTTLPQQALLYRLLGDRNPLHSDPEFAVAAGFPAPILHGLATYGIVCKAAVDGMLDGDVTKVRGFETRFAGVVFPGEALSTSVWREDGRLVLRTTVDERDNAPALSDTILELNQ
jgi:acyl dehydratase